MIKRPVFRYVSIVCSLLVGTGCFDDDPLSVDFHENEKKAANSVIPSNTGDAGVPGDSENVDTNGVCNPNWEPTWDDPVKDIMRSQCSSSSCHPIEVASYDSIQEWVNNGKLKTYCELGAGHYLEIGQEQCLRWLAIGAPESDCDVTSKK